MALVAGTALARFVAIVVAVGVTGAKVDDLRRPGLVLLVLTMGIKPDT